MRKKTITHYTKEQLEKMIADGADETDFASLKIMDDDSIDTSDIPEVGEDFWKNANLVFPEQKSDITIRLDKDVLNWLKLQGKGYQNRINTILRTYMNANNITSIP